MAEYKNQISNNTIEAPLPWSTRKRCCCCSAAQACPTLCDPMDCSTPGFPVLHCLPEFAQTHVHWVSDASNPHPLTPPSPPALNLSQHQGLLQCQLYALGGLNLSISPSNEYSGLISFRINWFDLLAVQGTLFSSTTVWKHLFFGAQPSLRSNSHTCTLEKP